MPPHDAVLPVDAQPAERDPDNLRADEATVVFAERLRFAVVLRQVARGVDEADFDVLDLSGRDEAFVGYRPSWAGTLAVVKHARTLRLTGWTDAAGVWRRE
jgi:hypothetical protein